ncbi:MAG: hypothetical protein GY856_43505 [bacterium]|nr:hypothetical protein [bacterium]
MRTPRFHLTLFGSGFFIALCLLLPNGTLVAGPSAPIPAQELTGAGPPLVPAGMVLRGWRDTSAEAVDGWIPFRFSYGLPAEKITSVEFHLTVQPIGQLTETDCFYCLDHQAKGVGLLCNFAQFAVGRKHIVMVYVDEENDPGILQKVRTGTLDCVLQDDTAIFAAQMVINPEFASPQEAVDYLEQKYPGESWENRWNKGFKPGQRFYRYMTKLKENDPNLFYRVRDMVLRRHEFYPGEKNIERLPGSQSDLYFCHDFAWRTGDSRRTKVDPQSERLPVKDGHIDPDAVMNDPDRYGFDEVSALWDAYTKLKPGDVVVYLQDDGKAAHSAVVARANPAGINDKGDVILLSKDVRNAIFRHTLGKEGEPNFFRDQYAAGGFKFYRRR